MQEPRTEHRTVPRDDLDSASVSLELRNGELHLRGGVEPLMDATFTYSLDEWRPEVEFDHRDGHGTLRVRQPEAQQKSRDPGSNARNRWDVELTDAIPLDLSVSTASASVGLDLGTVRIIRLNSRHASGSVTIDLSGDHADLEDVSIETASGSGNVVLPGGYPALARLAARSASGSLDLALTGSFGSVDRVDADSKSGNMTVDLRGDWRRDVQASLSAASGNVAVTLPSNVGVQLRATVMSGKLDPGGLRPHGSGYVNDLYETGRIALSLDIITLSGNIKVRQ